MGPLPSPWWRTHQVPGCDFFSKAVLAVLCIYYTYIIWCDSIESIDGNHREMMRNGWFHSWMCLLLAFVSFMINSSRVLSRNFEFPDFDTDFRGEKRSFLKRTSQIWNRNTIKYIKSYEFNLSHNPCATCNYRTDFFTYLMFFVTLRPICLLDTWPLKLVLPDTIPSWLLLSWIIEFVYMSFQEPNMYGDWFDVGFVVPISVAFSTPSQNMYTGAFVH